MNKKDIILTGIRSNDTPTIGNYLGAILPMAELQKRVAGSHQLNMFVPDLHSFTTPIDHKNLYENTLRNLKFFIAAELDIANEHTYIYRQSYIPAHSELAWILDCFAYFGELSRMTQYKEKSQQHDNVSVGLFNYPVLMAADILLYGARWVPLGDDQKQHLELARDLGERMNNKFGNLFVVPEPWDKQMEFAGRDNGVRIRSLSNPEKKMSKSVSDPRGTILLTDDPKDAAKKIMAATTDSLASIKFDFANQPGISNLLQILALLGGHAQAKVNAEWEGQTSYGELKAATATATEKFLTDFQTAFSQVDDDALLKKLEGSEAAMRNMVASVLLKVQQAVGLRPRI
ncbi:MAG TPA: tryptophan--tRNA ligase [Patescibacteria group bacterium]|jgi:tryptophanyl-tRNA synthetase|nr:tryptophan--tRNA ligase [Patescibacteria group bacterium]